RIKPSKISQNRPSKQARSVVCSAILLRKAVYPPVGLSPNEASKITTKAPMQQPSNSIFAMVSHTFCWTDLIGRQLSSPCYPYYHMELPYLIAGEIYTV